ncbi:hypothetical protein AB2L57_01770 [Microbacterium sp. HA-8]|uniref:hypothetical protein n=1 Tax=Microbacterium sp. HA-8 TaxID=3234200 RepID=UPI0038F67C85
MTGQSTPDASSDDKGRPAHPSDVLSMRLMSAGFGYGYLLRSIVIGDGVRDMTSPLLRYYTEKGAPHSR